MPARPIFGKRAAATSWILSIAAVCIGIVVLYYSTSGGGSHEGNHNGPEREYIQSDPKPETTPTAATLPETARGSKNTEIAKNAVAKVISLISRLRNATLSESDYVDELRKLGAAITGHDLRELFALLADASPPVPKLEQILVGAAQTDPETVWQIAQDNEMDNVSNSSNIELLGSIYANMVPLDRPAAAAFLEKTGNSDVIRRAALTRITARDGVNAVLDIIVDKESPFYSKESYGSVWAITNQVKTSGWNALQDFADKLATRAPEFGANAVTEPVKSMADLKPVETMEAISGWPASEAKSIAGNAAISTIARTNPDLALDLTQKFRGTEQERNNLLLGLQNAFLSINRQDLAEDCANLLRENGANP